MSWVGRLFLRIMGRVGGGGEKYCQEFLSPIPREEENGLSNKQVTSYIPKLVNKW